MMTDVTSLSKQTPNACASKLAMSAIESFEFQPTSRVQYNSHGRVAVIGPIEAQEFASRLNGNLHAQLILTDGAVETGVPTVPVGNRRLQIDGYLGNFNIYLGEEGRANYEKVCVDLIVDLSAEPLLTMPLKPPGYLTSIMEEPYLTLLEEELKGLTGTFEKPKYFDYDVSICAHGRSGIAGCTRCIDACPAQAITTLINSIKVNPNLCQGGGVCTSVCPTGAIRYVYPDATDMLRIVSTLLTRYCEAGGHDPVIAFVADMESALLENKPDNLLVVVVEETASVGMEVWFCALAMGAKNVLLIDAGSMPEMVGVFLQSQIDTANTILSGLGYKQNLIRIETPPSLSPPSFQAHYETGESIHPVDDTFELGSFSALFENHLQSNIGKNREKRRTTLLAIDFLYKHSSLQQSGSSQQIIALAEQSPFGRIMVDAEACTLCMSCTSVCPTRAISAGDDVPKLEFREVKCVQCGICESACPEQAISLEPRLIADAKQRRGFVTLHEEPPFCCITCGKAFATKSMIDNMTQKLAGHYMFKTERAKLRLMMCEDCRVVDVVQDNEAMGSV